MTDRICPVCGAPVDPALPACPVCGTALTAAATPARQAAPDYSANVVALCPVCGSALDPKTFLCTKCGGAQAQPAPAAVDETELLSDPYQGYPAPEVNAEAYQEAPAPEADAEVYPDNPAYAEPQSVQPAGPAAEIPAPSDPPKAASPAKKKSKTGLIIGVAVAAVAVICIVLTVFLLSGKPGNTGPTDGETLHVGTADETEAATRKAEPASVSATAGESSTEPASAAPEPTTGSAAVTPVQSDRYEGIKKRKWQPAATGKAPTRTVLIYMVGSTSESGTPQHDGGYASEALKDIYKQFDVTGKDRVLICTGGARTWKISFIPADQVCYYEIVEGGMLLMQENGDLNMGDGATLAQFLRYGMENYPAEAYDLILWGNGGGPMTGLCDDTRHLVPGTNAGDHLTLPELTAALKDAGLGGGKKLEIVVFNTNLMASVEVADACSPYAAYMVASEDTMRMPGLSFSFLKKLGGCADGAALGRAMVEAFMAVDETGSRTLSCLDLSAVGGVESALDALFADFSRDFKNGGFETVLRLLGQTKNFDGMREDGVPVHRDLYDLGHFAALAQSASPAGLKLLQAVEKLVVYADGKVTPLSGVTFFHPFHTIRDAASWDFAYADLGFCDAYCKYQNTFIAAIGDKTTAGTGTVGNGAADVKASSGGHTLLLQLGDALAKTYGDASYYVLKKLSDGSFLFLYGGRDAVLGTDGVLTATYSDRAIFAVNDKTGEVSSTPLVTYQLRDGGYEDFCCADCMLWDQNLKAIPVQFRFRLDADRPVPVNVTPQDDAGASLDYRTYSVADFFSFSRRLSYDDSGRILPYFRWTSTGDAYGQSHDVQEGFHFEYRRLTGLTDCYMMIEIRDIYGNTYVSNLYALKNT